jgi:hypothetical protein
MSYPQQPVTITAATTLSQDNHAGTLVILDSATGRIITLPASTGKGDVYDIVVKTAVSSGSHVIQVANSTDVIQGVLSTATTTTGAGTHEAAGGTDDTITLNGTTSGGLAGTRITLTDIVAGFWQVSGGIVGSGTLITPFSAAV